MCAASEINASDPATQADDRTSTAMNAKIKREGSAEIAAVGGAADRVAVPVPVCHASNICEHAH